MNVPIPPIFLYEHDFNRYEVMDGQQRLNAIIEFYSNQLTLKGLEFCSQLNGFRYCDFPQRVQQGLDRRRITATVLIADRASSSAATIELRRQVFDRLNTGGQKLKTQELRNCLYSGLFNDLLLQLAADSTFNDLWGIPRYDDNVRNGLASDVLSNNSLYRRMGDVELVLRYFAFRAPRSKIRGAVKKVLDLRMIEEQKATAVQIELMRSDFVRDLAFVFEVIGQNAFRLPEGKSGFGDHSSPFYDALMVATYRTSDKHSLLKKRGPKLRQAVRAAATANDDARELFVGRANTAKAILERLDRMEKAFLSVLK